MPKAEYERETGEYIQRQERLWHKHYFRVKYYDQACDKMLMLFIKKGRRFRLMQMWDVVGIMPAELWDEDAEEDDAYRAWYDTPIDGRGGYDWVEVLRLRRFIERTEEELEKIYEREWKQKQRCEHNRRFNKPGVKAAQAQLASIRDARKGLESRLRVDRLRLKSFKSASGVY